MSMCFRVGLTRQGVVCEVCGFACHMGCRDKVSSITQMLKLFYFLIIS